MPFAYPNTPLPMPYVAPPSQQPMSDMNIHNTNSFPPGQNNLGFVQLDDWFGNAGGHVEGGDEEANGGFGALDLQDFWMKVGPGEVSSIHKSIANYRHREASLSASGIYVFLGRSPNILVPTRTLLLPSLTA